MTASRLLTQWARYLFFRAPRYELLAMSWRTYLGPALLATWLAGMGRYWDHPNPHHLLQRLGIGSVVYVFALSAVLWLVIAPLRPRSWNYLQVVTFVALTSPPAFLYAIPVERWMSMRDAMATNAWFLLVVAVWRVGLLLFLLRRYAGLTSGRALIGGLLPLLGIIVALFMLNLEKAVFQFMAGFREPAPTPTAADGAYQVLFLLTLLSYSAAVPLLILYLACVVIAHKEARETR